MSSPFWHTTFEEGEFDGAWTAHLYATAPAGSVGREALQWWLDDAAWAAVVTLDLGPEDARRYLRTGTPLGRGAHWAPATPEALQTHLASVDQWPQGDLHFAYANRWNERISANLRVTMLEDTPWIEFAAEVQHRVAPTAEDHDEADATAAALSELLDGLCRRVEVMYAEIAPQGGSGDVTSWEWSQDDSFQLDTASRSLESLRGFGWITLINNRVSHALDLAEARRTLFRVTELGAPSSGVLLQSTERITDYSAEQATELQRLLEPVLWRP